MILMAQRPIRTSASPQLPATLPSVAVNPSDLYRISRFDSGEPYFGQNNVNRFDDPNTGASLRFGTCYLGTSLEVAVAETILHDIKPINDSFKVGIADLKSRYVVRFQGPPLTLANLTGAPLKRMGGLADLSGSTSYTKTKSWAAKIHAHPDQVDGMIYMSRHVTDQKAVVLFDRAKHRLTKPNHTLLINHSEFARIVSLFNIVAV
jgi:hypothetical protein